MIADKKPVILIASRGFWDERELANQKIFNSRFELAHFSDFNLSAEISQRVVAVVLGDALFDKEKFNLFPNLKIIARNGTGYDNIDLNTAHLKGITVTRVSNLNAKPVSEFVLGLILALSRNIVSMNNNMNQEIWQKERGKSFSEMTIGIVGLGSIGGLVTEKLSLLGTGKLIGWNRSRRPEVLSVAAKHGLELVELPKLMAESDVIVVSVLLTPGTTNLINQKLLSLMKPDAYLINISRGAVVDEEALTDLLVAGKIGGAALDVYSSEPPFKKLFMKKLVGLSQKKGNVILSPHSAALTKSIEREIVLKVAKNIVDLLERKTAGIEIL